jgi:hypothetical protein
MLKVFIFLNVLILNVCGTAQTIESIKKNIIEHHLLDAKTEVENLLAMPEHTRNADAWYFKGFIYNLLSKEDSLSLSLTNPKAIAFNAFVKCLELTPKHRWLDRDHYAPLIDIYYHFFQNGKTNYATKDYAQALDNFVNAEKVEQYLYKKGIDYMQVKFPALDTSLIYNIATTALKANKEKEGIFYFIKIAEAKLNDPIYIPVYHAIVDYFVSINDEIGFRKYLRIGRSLYPYDNYWITAEMDMVKAGRLNEALISSHEQKIKKEPNNFNFYYTYCSDLFTMLFFAETKPRNYSELKIKLESLLQTCLRLQTTGIQTEFLLAQFYYKDALQETINEPTEKQLELQNASYQKAIPYTSTVFEHYAQKQYLNKLELETYKMVTTMLIEMYTTLKQETEVLTYKEKQKTIEHILPVYQPVKKK